MGQHKTTTKTWAHTPTTRQGPRVTGGRGTTCLVGVEFPNSGIVTHSGAREVGAEGGAREERRNGEGEERGAKEGEIQRFTAARNHTPPTNASSRAARECFP